MQLRQETFTCVIGLGKDRRLQTIWCAVEWNGRTTTQQDTRSLVTLFDFSPAARRRSDQQNTDVAWRRRRSFAAEDYTPADSAAHIQCSMAGLVNPLAPSGATWVQLCTHVAPATFASSYARPG